MPFIQVVKKQWLRALIIAAIVAVGFYIFTKVPGAMNETKPFVPSEFLEARGKGVLTAQEIVDLSRESVGNLSAISTEDEIGNYTLGLDLVLKEVDRNAKARSVALDLSNDLGIMAASLTKVRPEDAAKIGLEAIINESQIVQRLINYNSYIFQLLDVLQTRFSKAGAAPDTNKKVQELISKMNEEVSAINELNGKYKGLMTQFDILTK